jgi:hypothetical protein
LHFLFAGSRIRSKVSGNRTNIENAVESKDSIQCGAVGAQTCDPDSDLSRIMDAWPTLPEADRLAVQAIVDTTGAAG